MFMNDNMSVNPNQANQANQVNYRDEDAKRAKPSGQPNTTRKFRNVLDKDDDGSPAKVKKSFMTSDEEEQTIALNVDEEEEKEAKNGFSLFMQRKSKVGLSKQLPQGGEADIIAEAESESEVSTQSNLKGKFNLDLADEEPLLPEDQVASSETKPFLPPSGNVKFAANVNAALNTNAKDMPKANEKAISEMTGAQHPTPLSSQKPLTSLFSPTRPNRPTGKAKTDSLIAQQNKTVEQEESENVASKVKSDLSDGDKTSGVIASESKISARKDNVAKSSFSLEQPVAVNPQPMVPPMDISVSEGASAKPIPPSATLQSLINQLVDQISVMTQGDKTETTLTLSQPPLFAGAQLILTGFESARGELNITLANLTQNAQVIVQHQQQNLLSSLEAKGYHVHIFTATTVENPIITADANQASKDQRDSRDDDREKRQQQSRRNPQGYDVG